MNRFRRFKGFTLWAMLLITAVSLSSCSADLDDYQQTAPTFDLFAYFSGETQAWGMVQDYTNQQTRRFHVAIKGVVTGSVLMLDEQFVYHDGERSRRVWTITRHNDGTYTGQADDIIGAATGQEVGNALRWQYDFLLKTDRREVTVHFDDWMYRQDATHLFNLTAITKWGVEVGKVTLFFTKS